MTNISVNKRIQDTDLPIMTMNALMQYNISTLQDLSDMTRDQLSQMNGLGKKGIACVEEVLLNHGYRLQCRRPTHRYRFDEDKLAVIVPRLQHQLRGMLGMQKAVYETLQALDEVMELERAND